MKKIFRIFCLIISIAVLSSPVLANDGTNNLKKEEQYSNEFNEYGVKLGKEYILKELESTMGVKSLTLNSTKEGFRNNIMRSPLSQNNISNWKEFRIEKDIPIDKDWTIEFSGEVTLDKIDGIVIINEDNKVFVPVKIRLFPVARQAVVTPVEQYLKNSNYSIRIFLNNGKRSKMNFTTISEKTSNTEQGNTFGNIVNKGLVAEDDGWIYYANGSDDYKLYKVKIDGSGKQKLFDGTVSYINVSDGWIYFSKKYNEYTTYLYKIRIDGTELTELDEDYWNVIEYTNLTNNKIYFIDTYGNRLYQYSKDAKIKDELIYGSNMKNLNVVGDYAYYTSDNDYLYKYSIEKDKTIQIGNDRAEFINVIKDDIYYINKDDGRIYKIKTDGSDKIKVNDDPSEYLNIYDDWAYYVNSKDRSIYRIKLDGTICKRINDSPSSLINIVSNCIYYVDPITNIQYKMTLEGRNHQQVN